MEGQKSCLDVATKFDRNGSYQGEWLNELNKNHRFFRSSRDWPSAGRSDMKGSK